MERYPEFVRIAALALASWCLGLAGCANLGDDLPVGVLANPTEYEFYNCKQLGDERKSLAQRAAELKGLMAKAETGAAGSVVADVVYGNDYSSTRTSARHLELLWQQSKCSYSTASDKPSASPASPPESSKRSIPPRGSIGGIY